MTITKSGDTQTNFVNQSFEIPNSDATGPAGWEGQPNLGTQNPDRYAWDNTVAHTGDYSVLIQVTQADLDAGSIDAAWRTSFPFENGAWYEVSAWVRTEDLGTNRFYFNMVYNNQSFGVMNQDTGGEWVEVVDTVQFAADFPLNNANRNLIRFRVGGSIQEGTQPKVWLDDVNIRLIGRAPHFSDEITAISDGEGTVHLSWEPSPGTENAVYHILMQPTSFENNLVQNPSFEIPNEAGSGPANWNIRELSPSAGGHTQLDEAIPEWPIEDAPPGGGQFSVSLRSEDLMSDKGAVIYFGQSIQTQAHFAYWFSTWVKTEDLFVPTGMIYSETYGDSLWKGGASIQTWTGNRSANSDPWIQSFGINTVIGTTDWHQMGVPVTHAQMTYYNNYVAVGIGEFPSWGASGQAWFDMVSVVPFEEVATTSNTSITLQNVPDSVEYFAVFVEDDVDGPDTYSKLNVSPAYVTKAIVNVAVGREELPDRITLYQNYPNPFNPATTIEYAIPRSAPVTLTVFDMLGRRVATLMENRVMEAGTHRISFDARDLASGIYVYRLEVGNQIETRMMQLLK